MKKETLVHMFATVQSLEKCVEQNRKMLCENRTQPEFAYEAVEQQAEILKKMRRVANQLQVLLVKQDIKQISRFTQIFYSLNSMVRPEIMSMFSSLANNEICFRLEEHQEARH